MELVLRKNPGWTCLSYSWRMKIQINNNDFDCMKAEMVWSQNLGSMSTLGKYP